MVLRVGCTCSRPTLWRRCSYHRLGSHPSPLPKWASVVASREDRSAWHPFPDDRVTPRKSLGAKGWGWRAAHTALP